jgi:hypothetical protein
MVSMGIARQAGTEQALERQPRHSAALALCRNVSKAIL